MNTKLLKIQFRFVAASLITITWVNKGRGFISGRQYARTYDVFIEEGDSKKYICTTSLQCNISNTEAFLKDYLKDR